MATALKASTTRQQGLIDDRGNEFFQYFFSVIILRYEPYNGAKIISINISSRFLEKRRKSHLHSRRFFSEHVPFCLSVPVVCAGVVTEIKEKNSCASVSYIILLIIESILH